MLLAINAGNTNVVFAVHGRSGWRERWRIATSPGRTSDEYAVWLLALLSHARLQPADISRCALGTVVPAALYTLRRFVRDWFGREPLVARTGSVGWGFEILVDRPMEVGADCLPNVLAAHDQYATPLIVVDFGTATTSDVVGEGGAHVGGVIAPGINLWIEAWHRARRPPPQDWHRPAPGGHWPGHGACHAIRDLLGLCRDGGGALDPDSGQVRRSPEGDRDRRPCPLVRGGDHRHSTYRTRYHSQWSPPVGGPQPTPHLP
jgi:hypothetical protein